MEGRDLEDSHTIAYCKNAPRGLSAIAAVAVPAIKTEGAVLLSAQSILITHDASHAVPRRQPLASFIIQLAPIEFCMGFVVLPIPPVAAQLIINIHRYKIGPWLLWNVNRKSVTRWIRVSSGDLMILRWGGTKQDSRAERAKKKFCTPHFSKCGGTSKQISVGAY